MKTSWIQNVVPMLEHSALRLTSAKATTIWVQQGLVWLTEEGVEEDSFLQAGQNYVVRGDGLVILSAESDARIVFEEPTRALKAARHAYS
jgi:Protein of unknown function (DUF2917)